MRRRLLPPDLLHAAFQPGAEHRDLRRDFWAAHRSPDPEQLHRAAVQPLLHHAVQPLLRCHDPPARDAQVLALVVLRCRSVIEEERERYNDGSYLRK